MVQSSSGHGAKFWVVSVGDSDITDCHSIAGAQRHSRRSPTGSVSSVTGGGRAPRVLSTPRGEKSRRLITERASIVFEQRGFAASSMSHLVETTGLTRGAFYFHFASKEAVALAIVQAQAERWPVLVEQVESEESEPLRRLLRLAFAAAAAVQGDPLIRAAHRLMTGRAAIRKELPWMSNCPADRDELLEFVRELNSGRDSAPDGVGPVDLFRSSV
jgi:AcrR family transcriptional regulator